MKRYLTAFFFLPLSFLYAAEKPRAAVFFFKGGNAAESQKLSALLAQRLRFSGFFDVLTQEDALVAEAFKKSKPLDISALGEEIRARYLIMGTFDSSKAIRSLKFSVYDSVKKEQSPSAEIRYIPAFNTAAALDLFVQRLEDVYIGRSPLVFSDALVLPEAEPAYSGEDLEALLIRYKFVEAFPEGALNLYRRRGVNARVASDGSTLLHHAAAAGYLDLAQALIKAGANPSVQDKQGWTPLHAAAYKDKTEIVRFFISRNISLSPQNNALATPLHIALGSGSAESARLLILSGADIDACDSKGQSPLHIAAHAEQKDLLDLLLSSGALPNISDASGRSPLHSLAACPWKEHSETFRLLLEYRASPNTADAFGKSPLQSAIEHRHWGLVRLLRLAGV